MNPLLSQIWDQVVTAQAVATHEDVSARLLRGLVQCYDESQRKYHTIRHLIECLELWMEFKDRIPNASDVVIALFYHDVVYIPTHNSNEEDSARRFLGDAGWLEISEPRATVIADMIRATSDHTSEDLATQHLLDIDMAILGASPERFDEYEAQIRAEYPQVDDETYRFHRMRFLRGLLERDRIFLTSTFTHLEEHARNNIRRLLATLEADA